MKQVSHYTIYEDQELGTGSFASVFRGRDKKNCADVAIKVLPRVKRFDALRMIVEMDETYLQAFEHEIATLRAIDSVNIVKFIELVKCEDYLYVVLELCDRNLREQLARQSWRSEQEALKLLDDLANGFMDTLTQNIVHRDLKPENILIKQGRLKICDFGVAARLPHFKCIITEPAGSIRYMAPEVLNGEKYSYKCDIWSIGMIFYELLHGYNPWYVSGDTRELLMKKVSTRPLLMKQSLHSAVKEFLRKTLQIKQENRMNYREFFEYTIFKKKFHSFLSKETKNESKLKHNLRQLKHYMDNHEIDMQSVFLSLQLPTVEPLSIDHLSRLFLLLDQILTKEQLTYFYMEIDSDRDGIISMDSIVDAIEKAANDNCQFLDTPNLQLKSFKSSGLIRIKSEKVITSGEFNQFIIESVNAKKPGTANFQTAPFALGLKTNKKLITLCQNFQQKVGSNRESFQAQFARYSRYNPVSIFSNEKRQDLLAYEGFQRVMSKYSQDLSRGQVKDIFDYLNQKSGNIYLCEKMKEKYKAITLNSFINFCKQILSQQEQSSHFDSPTRKKQKVVGWKDNLTVTQPCKCPSQSVPEGSGWKKMFGNTFTKKKQQKTNQVRSQNDRWFSPDNVEGKLRSIKMNKDYHKPAFSSKRQQYAAQFKSQGVIQDENEDQWAV